MRKRVRISEDYHEQNMASIEAIIINDDRLGVGASLVGFPLDSPFGWYDEDMSTSYNLWYISEEYLELVKVFSHNKFK